MAPNISGVWEVDHAKQIDLATKAFETAKKILCPGGNFFVKGFEGDLLKDYIDMLKQNFEEVKLVKPPASRAKSSEMYLLCLDFKGAESA